VSRTSSRGQSHVVGVVLLLGITVVALGGLTAAVGTVVDGQTAAADEARVEHAFRTELRPVEHTGPNEARVSFTEGRLSTVERDLRITTPAGTARTVEVGALIYESGQSRVAFLAGSVLRGTAGNAWLEREPPVTVTREGETLVVGAPRLGARGESVAGSGGAAARLRTNVSHERIELGEREYGVALETATPGPLARYFRRLNATTRVRDLDGDGVRSVHATFPGNRTLYLVVHRMRLEVAHG
jgi:FlaG/FlaF family flagellin (archaellin)